MTHWWAFVNIQYNKYLVYIKKTGIVEWYGANNHFNLLSNHILTYHYYNEWHC
jgi:hypothetical protein